MMEASISISQQNPGDEGMPQAEVVFCGKSPYLSGLATGLQLGGRLRVIRLESAFSQSTEELKMLRPEAVVFEHDETESDQAVMDFLKAYPRIRLIGLNHDGDRLTVFIGNERHTVPVKELGPVILDHERESAPNKSRGRGSQSTRPEDEEASERRL